MMANICVDTLIGSIPLFGDVFDFAYKSNLKNLRIYDQALIDRRAATVRNWGFFIAVFLWRQPGSPESCSACLR